MPILTQLLTLEPLERHPGRVLTAIAIVFSIAYVGALTLYPRSNGRIIDGDTIQYYAYLRSLVIDRDLDFTNDYRLLYTPVDDSNEGNNVWLTSKTPTGRATNLMSIGPALLWAPFFLATYAGLFVLRPFGLVVPLDGIAAPFPLSAGVAGIVYAALGAYFCYRACRLLFPNGPALWGTLVAWLATPAVYYSLVSPAYSHAPSLFASALFVYVWLKTRGRSSISRYLWLGILAGIAALVRWQEVIVLALPVLEIAQSVAKRQSSSRAAIARSAVMVGGVGLMLLPQLLAWRVIYGQMFVMPQGEGFMQWTSPAVVSVLFSLRHGLFSWTPAVLLAVLGLYYLVRRDLLVGWSAAIVVLLSIYINASVSDWWAGEAFGARRFVGDTVFFSAGLAAVFATGFWSRRPVLLRWTAVALIVYNLLFLVQYQLFMRGFRQIAPYPSTISQVLVSRLALPWTLLRAWLTG
jgi:hypothetical protein